MTTELVSRLRKLKVVPVVTLHRTEDAVPVAEALLEGGIDIIELTLRTPEALACAEQISEKVPDIGLGLGTVTNADQVDVAAGLNTEFIVSPGLSKPIIDACEHHELACLPGVVTPSEVMFATNLGCHFLKLFPAEASGGMQWLKALAGPFPDCEFCPTGGIHQDQAAAYLKQPNVVCVGGSWLTPASLIESGSWAEISSIVRQTLAQLT